MPEPLVSISSPSILPLLLYRDKGFQAALGLTLEQPRIRIRGGRIESEGDQALLGKELVLLSSMLSQELRRKRLVAVYEAAENAGLAGWRGSLATAGFAYGGLLMTAGLPGSLQPVASRLHMPSDTRVIVTGLPCRPRRRNSLKGMVEAVAMASSKNMQGFIRVLAREGALTLKQCSAAEYLMEMLGKGEAAVGASPTGLLYIVGRGMDMCKLGGILLDLGLTEGSIITSPQNYGARVEVSPGEHSGKRVDE